MAFPSFFSLRLPCVLIWIGRFVLGFRLQLFLIGVIYAVVFLSPAFAQDSSKNFGDWSFFCPETAVQSPQNGESVCALLQKAVVQDRAELSLTAIIVKSEDNSFLLRVQTPLGVLLSRELELWIDGKNIGSAPFLLCVETGCVSEVVMPQSLIDAFKAGSTAVFVYHFDEEKGLGLPVSLTGFSDGLSHLNASGHKVSQ